MRIRALELALALSVAWFAGGLAHAQSTGYELALAGTPSAMPGEHLRLAATVYEVQGLAALRPLGQGQLVARLVQSLPEGRSRVVVERSFTADGAGNVALDLAVPAEPIGGALTLVCEVGRRGDRSPRTFEFYVGVEPAVRFSVISDRVRYEPSETIHAFALLRRARTGAPVRDARVHFTVRGPSGVVHESNLTTRASGALYVDVPLAATAPNGTYTLTFAYDGGGSSVTAARSVQVGQRTVERMLVTAAVDQPVVSPGGLVRGRATVKTASGAPIANVDVHVSLGGATVDGTTDAEGVLAFQLRAPTYLSGDVERLQLEVRVQHSAYGTRSEYAPVVIARSPLRVEVVAQGGALVVDTATLAYLHVLDPLGEPARTGTSVEVTGVGVMGGTFRGAVDADGFVAVPMRVPNGASSRFEGGPCSGHHAVELEVTLNAGRIFSVTACARVSQSAQVAVRADRPVVAPGGALAFEVGRPASHAGDEVLVELLLEDRVVAAARVGGSATRGSLTVPDDVSGVLEIRARPLGRPGVVPGNDVEGATAYGTGSSDVVLVRPEDAFTFSLDAGQQVYSVRGTARVAVRTSRDPGDAFVTYVARDLAQHGGETDYAIAWLARFYEAAVLAPSDTPRDNLVRATLSAQLDEDSEARGVAPVKPRPWDPGDYGQPDADTGRGELRDPLRQRDELLRRRAAQLMVTIEQLVQQEIDLEPDAERTYTNRNGGFPADLIRRMVEVGGVAEETVETLGGRQMTLAMLQSADPSFRYETVAARLCRTRLAQLMLTLLAYTDPDSPEAARALAGTPPTRWLSRLVEIGAVQPVALRDPWGRAFVFRPAAGGTPRFVLSDRAPTFELVSAGPDGRPGTGDDVRDPFARVLPEGSPYAVASGEDDLLASIASIAPGGSTLSAMLRAYSTLSLSALDESRESVVTAAPSEEMPMAAMAGEAYSMDDMEGGSGLGMLGRGGGGGSGYGYGTGGGSLSSRASVRPVVRPGAPPPPPPGSTLARVGELVREGFPATLFFAGELPLPREGSFDIPLKDALTTYRVEGIAWNAHGWITTARTELRVDQEATVDAAVPENVTAGDELRIPVRIENRGLAPLRARIGFAAEGVDIAGGEVQVVEVEARGVLETIVPLRVQGTGSGHLVIRLVRDSDGSALDATRRPVTSFADSRLVRATRREFLPGSGTLDVVIPPDAIERDPGELRVATGFEFFGALDASQPLDQLDRAWARGLAGLSIAPEDRALAVEALLAVVRDDSSGSRLYYPIVSDQGRYARALAVAWGDPTLTPEIVVQAAEHLSHSFPEDDAMNPELAAQLTPTAASSLLGLAPIVRRGAELPESVRAVVDRLHDLVRDGAAVRTDEVPVTVLAAAALAGTRGATRDARADELLRRLERFVVSGSDGRFLEADDVGRPHARELPTALLALAHAFQGDRALAFDTFRGLATRPERTLSAGARVHAAAVAGLLLSASGEVLSVRLDGQALALRDEAGMKVAALPGLGRPGSHRLSVEVGQGSAALVQIEVRYGRPWNGEEARRLPVRVAVEGEVGARDTRAGLAIELRNEGARVVREPIVEIDLPAGAELDEQARGLLRAQTRVAPTLEGRTLRLVLRPLAPGGRVRIPLRVRWTVAGRLRGLGVTVLDDSPTLGDVVARSIAPSRELVIADRGAEPEAAESAAEAPPPPPPPPPPPIPLLRTLTPAVEVIR